MKYIPRGIFAMVALFICCGHAPARAEPQPLSPEAAREGTATIYFFRTTNVPEDIVGLLSLDGVEIGQAAARRYAVICVKPGSHELKLSFPLWTRVNDQSVAMEFERNRSYYLSYTTFMGAKGVSPAAGEGVSSIESEMKLVSEAEAKPFMEKQEPVFKYDVNAATGAGIPTASASQPATAGVGQATGERNDQVVLLNPFVISESEKLSFNFSIRVIREQPTNRLVEMYVDRVLAGSDAEEVGLAPGAKIVAIDGKAVEQYEATFRNNSALRKIFINRREGDQVTLVVIDPGATQRRTIVVTRRRLIWTTPR